MLLLDPPGPLASVWLRHDHCGKPVVPYGYVVASCFCFQSLLFLEDHVIRDGHMCVCVCVGAYVHTCVCMCVCVCMFVAATLSCNQVTISSSV